VIRPLFPTLLGVVTLLLIPLATTAAADKATKVQKPTQNTNCCGHPPGLVQLAQLAGKAGRAVLFKAGAPELRWTG
jgi:hypothetical protein